MGERKPRVSVPLGPSTRAAAKNIRRFREARGLTQEELSDKAKDQGHPLEVPAIRAIENGRRRIDVDDLTVLAFALNVSPLELLLPWEEGLTGVPSKDYSRFEVSQWMKEKTGLDDESLQQFWTRERARLAEELAEALEVRGQLIASGSAQSYIDIPERNVKLRLKDVLVADGRIEELSQRTGQVIELLAPGGDYLKGASLDPLSSNEVDAFLPEATRQLGKDTKPHA